MNKRLNGHVLVGADVLWIKTTFEICTPHANLILLAGSSIHEDCFNLKITYVYMYRLIAVVCYSVKK